MTLDKRAEPARAGRTGSLLVVLVAAALARRAAAAAAARLGLLALGLHDGELVLGEDLLLDLLGRLAVGRRVAVRVRVGRRRGRVDRDGALGVGRGRSLLGLPARCERVLVSCLCVDGPGSSQRRVGRTAAASSPRRTTQPAHRALAHGVRERTHFSLRISILARTSPTSSVPVSLSSPARRSASWPESDSCGSTPAGVVQGCLSSSLMRAAAVLGSEWARRNERM